MAVRRLAELAWTEVPEDSLLVVPVGSCEQHGPHLPLDTDLRVALALCDGLAGARDDVVIAPPVTLGASGEHQAFPGTLSIGTLALESVIVELARSALPSPVSHHVQPGHAQDGRSHDAGPARPSPFRGVVFVNGHGGNIEALQRAEALLVDESRSILVWSPQVPGGDSHAGRTETSILLHLDPGSVRTDRIERGSTRRWREIGPLVLSEGLAAVTPNGILGDPTDATADEGERVLADLTGSLVDAVERLFGASVGGRRSSRNHP